MYLVFSIEKKAKKMQEDIAELVKEESRKKYKKVELPWFWEKHILIVVKITEKLLKYYPGADRKVCLISAYLHDIGRTSYRKEDHAISGKAIIQEILSKYNYPKDKTNKVLNACLSHSCNDLMPNTLEEKLIASADAISHLIGDFYFRLMIFWMKDKEFDEVFGKIKEKIKEKIDRDFNKKIFFPKGKEMVRKKYEAWVELLEN